MILTTDDILASVKRRSLIPISQQTFQDADLVSLLNEELYIGLVPEILSVREDYFLRVYSYPIQASISKYAIPERSIGNAIKDVFFLDLNQNRRTLPRTKVHDLEILSPDNNDPDRILLRGDEIILIPTPGAGAGGYLEIYTLERPNQLVLTSAVAKITAIASLSGTTTFTVDTNLTGTLAAASKADVYSGRNPCRNYFQDIAVTAITSTTIAFATTDVDDEAGSVQPIVGDYISVAQQAHVPQIPSELHPILPEMVICRTLEALGDGQKLQMAMAKLTETKKSALKMISNRIEGASQHIINRKGMLNSMRYYSNRFLTR